MKTKFLIACLALATPALLLCGCILPLRSSVAKAPAVRILAYINVSSGCQQATVDLLQSLPTKYPGVGVELVDFGDGGQGTDRWRQAGLRCMTIQINECSVVKYPVAGKMKVMAFHMPAGFYWTHEDLELAVQAALAGKLQAATEEEWGQAGNEAPTPEQMRKQQSKHTPAAEAPVAPH